jgi:hypothetical protein
MSPRKCQCSVDSKAAMRFSAVKYIEGGIISVTDPEEPNEDMH